MKRRFGLPAAFALALLAQLFFGFTKKPTRPALPGATTLATEYVFPPLPLDLEPESMEMEKTLTSAATEAPPELPDHSERLRPDVVAPPRPERPPVTGNFLHIDARLFRPGPGTQGGEIWGSTTVDAALLDNSPRARAQRPPVYPPMAKVAGLNGEVIVEFMVDPAGRVLSPRVVRSSDRMFDEPTLNAVAKWVFEPGRKNNRPVSFRMMVPVLFRLGE